MNGFGSGLRHPDILSVVYEFLEVIDYSDYNQEADFSPYTQLYWITCNCIPDEHLHYVCSTLKRQRTACAGHSITPDHKEHRNV